MPETEKEGARVRAEWGAWFESMGEAVTDGSAPVGLSKTVHSDGSATNDGGANPTSGYSLIYADNIDQAIELARGCPILQAEGSNEVAEAMDDNPRLKINLAVALSYPESPKTGLSYLAQNDGLDRLQNYCPYHAALANMQRRQGNDRKTINSYCSAITLCENRIEKSYLEGKLSNLNQ
jgi:hypothetical protein